MGDETEPALDLIEPGAVGRNVMDMVARPPCQPGFDRGVFVGTVVVHHQVHIEPWRHGGIDVAQEA